MKATFNQYCAAGLILLTFAGMMIIYFNPLTNAQSLGIGTIIGSSFTASVMFLIKASSDAKNSDAIKDMTEKLSNSVPMEVHLNAIKAEPEKPLSE